MNCIELLYNIVVWYALQPITITKLDRCGCSSGEHFLVIMCANETSRWISPGSWVKMSHAILLPFFISVYSDLSPLGFFKPNFLSAWWKCVSISVPELPKISHTDIHTKRLFASRFLFDVENIFKAQTSWSATRLFQERCAYGTDISRKIQSIKLNTPTWNPIEWPLTWFLTKPTDLWLNMIWPPHLQLVQQTVP